MPDAGCLAQSTGCGSPSLPLTAHVHINTYILNTHKPHIHTMNSHTEKTGTGMQVRRHTHTHTHTHTVRSTHSLSLSLMPLLNPLGSVNSFSRMRPGSLRQSHREQCCMG